MKRALVVLILLLASPVLADSTDEQLKLKMANVLYALGVRYHNGQGVTQDHAEAVKWYRKAAERGHAKAQFNLGIMYRDGTGVIQDYSEAVRWFVKVAEQGDVLAQYEVGYMYANYLQDYGKAVAWYCEAARREYAEAMNSLGVMYQQGIGFPRDYVHAHKWYNLAAARGSKFATENRKKVETLMLWNEMTSAVMRDFKTGTTDSPIKISHLLQQAQRLAREWTPDKPCP